jgi:hypothetical protein
VSGGKTACTRHGRAYDLDVGCDYCTAEREEKALKDAKADAFDKLELPLPPAEEDWFPQTLEEFEDQLRDDPFGVAIMMDKKFGYTWRSMDEKEMTDFIHDLFGDSDSDDSGKIT